MKIGPIDNKAAVAAAQGERNAPAAKTASNAQAEASAQVELSSTAALMSGEQDGTFDTKKVEAIAQAIRDGKFKVNPEAIADKLISNAAELLGKPSH